MIDPQERRVATWPTGKNPRRPSAEYKAGAQCPLEAISIGICYIRGINIHLLAVEIREDVRAGQGSAGMPRLSLINSVDDEFAHLCGIDLQFLFCVFVHVFPLS
jgi:hypothetical protein